MGGKGGSSWASRGHPGRDPDRLVASSFSVLLHTGRRVGGGEYNFARGVEFSFFPSPLLPASTTPLSSPLIVCGGCTLGLLENTITQEERKTCCQIELTQQGGEDRIREIESDENIDKKSKKKAQASSRKGIDREVVDKRQDTDKEERKTRKNKAAKREKIKK